MRRFDKAQQQLYKLRMLKKCVGTIFFVIAAELLIACASTPANIAEPGEYKLTILHTNDLHGSLENMPQYYTIVKQVRSEGGNVLLLDGGDLYRRGKYERFNGAVETEIFNIMKYDAIVFGNSDFPLSDNELYDVSRHTILKMANFPVLCGNVTIDGEYIEGFQPYVIINLHGINTAVIGITSLKPQTRGYDISKRALFDDPKESLSRLVAETKEKSDIQIALSHAGFFTDITLRGVSAVIGADTHIKLGTPYVSRGRNYMIPVVQAGGEDKNYLGRLDLVYRQERGQWVLKSFRGSYFSLKNISKDAEIQEILDKYNEKLISQQASVFEITETA
jgi:5'-nucleotidase